jgi:hypothetical protein
MNLNNPAIREARWHIPALYVAAALGIGVASAVNRDWPMVIACATIVLLGAAAICQAVSIFYLHALLSLAGSTLPGDDAVRVPGEPTPPHDD